MQSLTQSKFSLYYLNLKKWRLDNNFDPLPQNELSDNESDMRKRSYFGFDF